MRQEQRLKLSQKAHIRIWRETLNGKGNDAKNHSYHAKVALHQTKKGRILTKAEKKAIYRGLNAKQGKAK